MNEEDQEKQENRQKNIAALVCAGIMLIALFQPVIGATVFDQPVSMGSKGSISSMSKNLAENLIHPDKAGAPSNTYGGLYMDEDANRFFLTMTGLFYAALTIYALVGLGFLSKNYGLLAATLNSALSPYTSWWTH